MHTQIPVPRSYTALAHVLAVDDDSMLREAISEYLGKYEFRVTAVADGRAMQAVLAAEVVDLVVLDLKLQTEDQWHLLKLQGLVDIHATVSLGEPWLEALSTTDRTWVVSCAHAAPADQVDSRLAVGRPVAADPPAYRGCGQ